MEILEMRCKSCGAPIRYEGKDAAVRCEYCGTYNNLQESDKVGGTPEAQLLLRRAYLYLSDKNYTKAKEYFNRALNADPEYAEAYFGLVLASVRISSAEEAGEARVPLERYSDYEYALKFANEQQRQKFIACNEAALNGIKARYGEAAREKQEQGKGQTDEQTKTMDAQAQEREKTEKKVILGFGIFIAIFLILCLWQDGKARTLWGVGYTEDETASISLNYNTGDRTITVADYYEQGLKYLEDSDARAIDSFFSAKGYSDSLQKLQWLSNITTLPVFFENGDGVIMDALGSLVYFYDEDGTPTKSPVPQWPELKELWQLAPASEQSFVGLTTDGRLLLSENGGETIELAGGKEALLGIDKIWKNGNMVIVQDYYNEFYSQNEYNWLKLGHEWDNLVDFQVVFPTEGQAPYCFGRTLGCTVVCSPGSTEGYTFKQIKAQEKMLEEIAAWKDVVAIAVDKNAGSVMALHKDGTVAVASRAGGDFTQTARWTRIVEVGAWGNGGFWALDKNGILYSNVEDLRLTNVVQAVVNDEKDRFAAILSDGSVFTLKLGDYGNNSFIPPKLLEDCGRIAGITLVGDRLYMSGTDGRVWDVDENLAVSYETGELRVLSLSGMDKLLSAGESSSVSTTASRVSAADAASMGTADNLGGNAAGTDNPSGPSAPSESAAGEKPLQ